MHDYKLDNINIAFEQFSLMINDTNRRIDFLEDDIHSLRSLFEELKHKMEEAGLIDG